MAETYTRDPYSFDVPAYESELSELYGLQTTPSPNHTIMVSNKIETNKLISLLSCFGVLYDDEKPCFGTAKYHTEMNLYMNPTFAQKYNAILNVAKLLNSPQGKTLLTKSCRDNKFVRLPDFKYFFDEFNYCLRSQDVDEKERVRLIDELAATTFSCITDKQNNLSSLYAQLQDKDKRVIEREMEKIKGEGKK